MAEHEPPLATAGLQLDHAEFEHPAPAAITCAQCQRAIADQYYEAGGRTVCDRCRRLIEAELNAGSPIGRFVRSAALGILAGILGSMLWFAIRRLSDSEWGLIAIAVGWLVGTGVRMGSRNRGGWLYQLLAVGLTYLAIVGNYVPDAFEILGQNEASGEALPAPVRLVVAMLTALVVPFLGGFQNIIGLLIIGFGMYQAWAMNKRVQMTFNGPFRVGVAPPAPPASA